MHRFVITRATTSTLTPTPMTRSSSTIWEGGRDGGIAGKGTDGAATIGLEGDGGSSGGSGGSGGSDGRFEGVEGGEGGEGGEKGGEGGVGGEGGEGGEKGGAGCCGNAGGNAGGTAAPVSACEPAASMADNARTPMLFVGAAASPEPKSQLWSGRRCSAGSKRNNHCAQVW